MTDSTIAMMEELRKLELGLDGDTLREMASIEGEMLMELEVEKQIGAP